MGRMSTDQLSVFFGLLAVGALALGGLALVGSVVSRIGQRAVELRPLLLPLAFVVAVLATAGSLYYSEIAHYTPCELCWYQRICMYPLTVVLGVALLRRDDRGGLYALPLAVAGLGVSIYHYQLQMFPEQGSSCDTVAPCTFQWVDTLGFMSIPFMAGCGFLAVIGLATLSLRLDSQPDNGDDVDELVGPPTSEVLR